MKTFNEIVEHAKDTIAQVETATGTMEAKEKLHKGDPAVVEQMMKCLSDAAIVCAMFDVDIDGAVRLIHAKADEVGYESILAEQLSRATPQKIAALTKLLKRVVNAD